MLCHKCPHQREILRLQKICCACSDKEIEKPSGKGKVTVSMDAMTNVEGLVGGQYKIAKTTRTASENGPTSALPPDIEMRLRDELAAFLRLSYMNQMLLVWILRGGGLSEFSRLDWIPKAGRKNGFITRQAVDERVRTLKNSCPNIALVIEQMIKLNSGSRGKTKQRQR